MAQDPGGTHLRIIIATVIMFELKTKDMLCSKYEEQIQRTEIPWQPVELKRQDISPGFSKTDKDMIK